MEKTKNIISFDVGMKNLAYCIFQVCETTCKVKILKWDVINLCTPIVRKCNTLGCTQDAKYCKTFRTPYDDDDGVEFVGAAALELPASSAGKAVGRTVSTASGA